MWDFFKNHPVAAPLAFVGAVMAPARFVLDGLDIAQLGLPGWAWSAIGTVIVIGAVVAIVFRQHRFIQSISNASKEHTLEAASSASLKAPDSHNVIDDLSLRASEKRRTNTANGEVFTEAHIRITDLVSDDDFNVRECVFNSCVLIGPAVILLNKGQILPKTRVPGVSNIEHILIEIENERRIGGVIFFHNCTFRNCTLKNVAIAGSRNALDSFASIFKGS